MQKLLKIFGNFFSENNFSSLIVLIVIGAILGTIDYFTKNQGYLILVLLISPLALMLRNYFIVKAKNLWKLAYKTIPHFFAVCAGYCLMHLTDNLCMTVYAGLTKDVYSAKIIDTATLTRTEKWGTINIWTIEKQDTKERYPVTVRDLYYPFVAFQRNSADVQTQLNSNVGNVVRIHEVFERRGKGVVPFWDRTSFPVVFQVEENY